MSEQDTNNNADVTASNQDAVDSSSTEQTAQTNTVPLENRLAEMNRKFGRLEDKFSQLISSLAPQANTGADKAPIENQLDYSVKTAVNQAILQDKHAQSYREALRSYPELDKSSETFDQDFFQLSDKYYTALAATNDPDAPVKAIRLAAMDLGKYEKIERERFLADEAKRMRTLGDGSNAPRSGQKGNNSGGLPKNLQGLAQLLKVDTKGLEAHMKKNSNRYGN